MKKVSDPPDDHYALALRQRSGTFKTSDPLVSFLYLVMRDHLTPGNVEYMLLQLEAEYRVVGRRSTPLTNGWLGAYAADVAKRLTQKSKKRKSKRR